MVLWKPESLRASDVGWPLHSCWLPSERGTWGHRYWIPVWPGGLEPALQLTWNRDHSTWTIPHEVASTINQGMGSTCMDPLEMKHRDAQHARILHISHVAVPHSTNHAITMRTLCQRTCMCMKTVMVGADKPAIPWTGVFELVSSLQQETHTSCLAHYTLSLVC